MTTWRILREWRFEGPGEAGADLEGGLAFALERSDTGEQRQLSVAGPRGGIGVSDARLRELARSYLNEPDPPQRVIADSEGNAIRTVPSEPSGPGEEALPEEPAAGVDAELAGDPDVEWD